MDRTFCRIPTCSTEPPHSAVRCSASDQDLIVEARRRQRQGVHFAGVIFAPQSCPVSACIEQLEVIAKLGEPAELERSLLFLPLR